MRRWSLVPLVVPLMWTCTQGWAWEFNEDDNLEGWFIGHAVDSIEVKDGRMIARVTAGTNDPYINGPFGPYDGDRITGLAMRMRWSFDALGLGGPSIYYFPADGSHGSSPYEAPPPDEWHVVLVDFIEDIGGDRPVDWGGMINMVRIDLADSVPEDYVVEIDWVRLVTDYIENESFTWGDLAAWEHMGEGSIADYVITDAMFFSMDFCVEVNGLGSDRYHALIQPIWDGLSLEKGSSVAVVGAVYIPSDSWDANSTLWFRIQEFDGTTENLSPPVEVTTFDEWFQFESRVTLQYEPADRTALAIQLFSKNPSGAVFYFDDIFVDVQPPGEEVEEGYWRWVNANWEFNTDGDTEGWTIGNPDAIDSLEAVGGSLVVTVPAGVEDPYINGPEGPFNSDRMSGAAVRMRISFGADVGGYENFWFPVDGGFRSKTYSIPVEGEWFVLYQDLSGVWDGWFNYFRYDFGNFYAEDVIVEIDWIRFVDEYIDNNGFEGSLDPWRHEGAGTMDAFSLTTDQVFSGETALEIKGLGSDQYHAAFQDIEDGLEIPQGATVVLKGCYFVPSGSWDADSHVWFRIKEFDGSVENLSPGITDPVFDAWVPFEYSVELIYEPSKRTAMQIQLYSKTPAGSSIYADDVFATVYAPQTPTEVSDWPLR